MADGRKHSNNDIVRDFCTSRACKLYTVAAYSLWVNRLVEGTTNKLFLHVLKHLCTSDLEEDKTQPVSWKKLPSSWLEHLDNAVYSLNHYLLPALKFSPKELLLGLVVNTPPTSIEESTWVFQGASAITQIAYTEQQCLDRYEETVCHTIRWKSAFDKKLLQYTPKEVIFHPGQLVQVYYNNLDYTFKAECELIPKWLTSHRVQLRILNYGPLGQWCLSPIPAEACSGSCSLSARQFSTRTIHVLHATCVSSKCPENSLHLRSSSCSMCHMLLLTIGYLGLTQPCERSQNCALV